MKTERQVSILYERRAKLPDRMLPIDSLGLWRVGRQQWCASPFGQHLPDAIADGVVARLEPGGRACFRSFHTQGLAVNSGRP
jgi:hypothetical protein